MGMGMRLTMYSLTASMLYFSCADMGTMGEDSATVPVEGGQRGANEGRIQRTFNEGGDALLVLQRLRLLNEVDFVLEDNYVLQFHDLDCCEMLGCLGLRAGFVPGDEKQRGVHDRGTV
jgi:hypothetical protein